MLLDLIKARTDAGGYYVIGLTGYGRSGKDTVGEMLKVALRDGLPTYLTVETFSLATSLKAGLEAMTDRDYLSDTCKTAHCKYFRSLSKRDVMIAFGDWARSYNEDIFKEILQDRIERLDTKVAIVTDIRRYNELAMCDTIIRVERPGVMPAASHPTEGELDNTPMDFTIRNDGDLIDLQKVVWSIL